jgi:predicted MFS family arabinose efflux permease
MSTLTSTEPSRGTGREDTPGGAGTPGGRLISGPLALVFLSEFCALTSFYVLLSVMPMSASAAGAGTSGAGLVTGVLLLGTVAAELAAPFLMRRYGYPALLATGALLLGIPALALLPGGSLVTIVTVSVIRGFGFGLSTVLTGALTARLLPPERRGEGLGLFGVVATAPGVVALPAGVWLADHCGVAIVLGITAATALVPLAAFPWLPRTARPQAHAGPTGPGRPDGLLAALCHRGQLRPFLIFTASTVAAGVVVSFLPLAAGVSSNIAAAGLLLQALTATLGRWWAGRHGDRSGHHRLLVPALAIASLGMITMIWLASAAAVIAGMCLFGAGFGISQNATFALMIDRMPPSGVSTASALWNLAYDAGYGAGPAVFGLFISHTGFPAAFALTGALMLAALPAARREHAAGRAHGAPAARLSPPTRPASRRPLAAVATAPGSDLGGDVVERGVQVGADQGHRGHDDDRDQRHHQAVFNGGCAAVVPAQGTADQVLEIHGVLEHLWSPPDCLDY